MRGHKNRFGIFNWFFSTDFFFHRFVEYVFQAFINNLKDIDKLHSVHIFVVTFHSIRIIAQYNNNKVKIEPISISAMKLQLLKFY